MRFDCIKSRVNPIKTRCVSVCAVRPVEGGFRSSAPLTHTPACIQTTRTAHALTQRVLIGFTRDLVQSNRNEQLEKIKSQTSLENSHKILRSHFCPKILRFSPKNFAIGGSHARSPLHIAIITFPKYSGRLFQISALIHKGMLPKSARMPRLRRTFDSSVEARTGQGQRRRR